MSKTYSPGDRVEVNGTGTPHFVGRKGVVVNDVSQSASGNYHVRFDNAGTYAFRPDQLNAPSSGDLQSKVEAAIRETLYDREGAGSDLTLVDGGPGDEWLYVQGNLDVQHLASHIIAVIKEG